MADRTSAKPKPKAPSPDERERAEEMLETFRKVDREWQQLEQHLANPKTATNARRRIDALDILLSAPRISLRQLKLWLQPPRDRAFARLKIFFAHRHLTKAIYATRYTPTDWMDRLENREAYRFHLERARIATGTPKKVLVAAINASLRAGELRDGQGPANAAIRIMADFELGDPKTIRDQLFAHPGSGYGKNRRPRRTSPDKRGTGCLRSELASSARKDGAVHDASQVTDGC